MTAFWISIKNFAFSYAWTFLWIGGLLTLVELTIPASRYSLFSRFRGYGFWLINIAIMAVALSAFYTGWRALDVHPLWTFKPYEILNGVIPGTRIWAPIGFLEIVVAVYVGHLVFTFFYYWFHRAQHVIPWLWKFHEVHHSITEMSALNCNHHFTEEIFRIPFITLPMSILIGVDSGPLPFVIASLISLQPLYEHSCASLRLPLLKYVLNDNSYHRIRHSIEERHWNKNFSTFLPLWDILFRTIHFPTKNEWPDTGVAGVREPLTVADMLFMPFRKGNAERIEQDTIATPLDAERT